MSGAGAGLAGAGAPRALGAPAGCHGWRAGVEPEPERGEQRGLYGAESGCAAGGGAPARPQAGGPRGGPALPPHPGPPRAPVGPPGLRGGTAALRGRILSRSGGSRNGAAGLGCWAGASGPRSGEWAHVP